MIYPSNCGLAKELMSQQPPKGGGELNSDLNCDHNYRDLSELSLVKEAEFPTESSGDCGLANELSNLSRKD